MQNFQDTLKKALKKIEGKKVSLPPGPSNCIRIVLRGGKEYWGTVKFVGDDMFTLVVSYTGGGRENIIMRLEEVASFSDQ